MKKRVFFLNLTLLAAGLCSQALFAEDTFIVVGKQAKVFDTPNAKGYVTLNQQNEEVVLQPSMAFKLHEEGKGWTMIEYSPGLRGYVANLMLATPAEVKPGSYKVSNHAGKTLRAEKSDAGWNATVDGKSYAGKDFGNVVMFFDEKKNPAYSLVDCGEGPVAVSYANEITKFF